MDLTQDQLLELSKKYIWSQPPQEAIKNPNKIILRVLDIGTFEDANLLINTLNKEILIDIIQNSEIGSLRKKSWHYWHIVLDICDYQHIPPMPSKRR